MPDVVGDSSAHGEDGARLRSERSCPCESEKKEMTTVEQLKLLRGREFLEKSIVCFDGLFVDAIMRMGVDISDHSPERLRAIDDHFFESAREACLKEGIPPEPGILWSMYHGVGSYFGTVIERNLGGKWRTPSVLRLWLSQILGNPAILFDHWYVESRGNRIPVFKIARWRCDGSGRVTSLAQEYEKIVSKGSWP